MVTGQGLEMNIIVKPQGSDLCYCRPDTTWERENRDFYVPDGVGSLYWAPVIFARISKAGKCINPKFVSRYYDAFNFGMLMYTGDDDVAFTSCADHTSILPSPIYNAVVMEGENNGYQVEKGGEVIFRTHPDRIAVEEAICRASRLTSVRIGDYVALELDEKKLLNAGKDPETYIKGTFCGNEVFGFKVIF